MRAALGYRENIIPMLQLGSDPRFWHLECSASLEKALVFHKSKPIISMHFFMHWRGWLKPSVKMETSSEAWRPERQVVSPTVLGGPWCVEWVWVFVDIWVRRTWYRWVKVILIVIKSEPFLCGGSWGQNKILYNMCPSQNSELWKSLVSRRNHLNSDPHSLTRSRQKARRARKQRQFKASC